MEIALDLKDVTGYIGYFITNRTTCSSQTTDPLNQFGHDILDAVVKAAPTLHFTIDTSPTAFNLQVDRERDNYIDFEFYTCPNRGKCEKWTTVEKGTMVLKVDYSEATLPDTKEVSDCPKN
jgi:hypothetical protein